MIIKKDDLNLMTENRYYSIVELNLYGLLIFKGWIWQIIKNTSSRNFENDISSQKFNFWSAGQKSIEILTKNRNVGQKSKCWPRN